MSVIAVTVEPDGAHIPLQALDALGLHPGDVVSLQMNVIARPESIRRNGKYFCWRSLGDALRVGRPRKQGQHWVSELTLAESDRPVGRIMFSEDGCVLPELSSSKQDIFRAVDAPGP